MSESREYWISIERGKKLAGVVYDIRYEGGWLVFEQYDGGNPNAELNTVAIPPTWPTPISYGLTRVIQR